MWLGHGSDDAASPEFDDDCCHEVLIEMMNLNECLFVQTAFSHVSTLSFRIYFLI